MKFNSKARQDICSATIAQSLWLILLGSGVFAVTAYASDPSWWSLPGTGSQGAVVAPVITTNNGVVTTNYAPNDNAVVTQGQLKQFTVRAVDELNAHLPGGAGTNLNSMVSNWASDYATNGYNATNIKPSDYTAMNVGQLKYVGNQVWAQLVAGFTNAAPTWLAQNTNSDNAAANLGQLKEVFDFNPPYLTSATTAGGTAGATFSYTITASNSPTSFSLIGLLPGLTIDPSTGVISGTPTAAGTYTVIVSMTNALGSTYSTVTFTFNPPVPVITSSTTASGTAGQAFNYEITANNSPTSFGVTGTLPAGLGVDPGTGIISGTPTTAGTGTVTLDATNAGGTGTVTLTLTVSNPSTPPITSGAPTSGTVGDDFSYTVTADNNPTSFSIVSGALPAGLSLDTGTGMISGTPTVTGTFSVGISATNAGGAGATTTLTFTINGSGTPVITSDLTATVLQGGAFNYPITATHSPTSYSESGTLPDGLTYASGVISGTTTLTTASTSTITIGAGNSSGTGTATLILNVNPPPPAISSGTTTGNVGVAFLYPVAASNSPTSFTATGLPAGLNIDPATGVISGTPTIRTPFGTPAVVTLGATNPGGTGTGTLTLTINVPGPVPVINSGMLVSGADGVAFSNAITTSTVDGSSPTTYSATGLPSGLSIDASTGVISGTHTGTGTFTVTVHATNAWGTGSATLTLIINNATAPVISSATTASGNAGAAFSYTLTASQSPTSYSVSGLPLGLSFNSGTHVISGTPAAAGTSAVILHATNSAGTATSTLTLTINPPVPVISSPTTASGAFGVPITPYTITASNSPTGFSATGLPPGLSFDASRGTISGTPLQAGTFTTTIGATNDDWVDTGTASLTFTISALNSSTPPIVTRSIANGNQHSLMLKSDGTVWATGYNNDGELGNGGNATSPSYLQVSGLSGVVAVTAGYYSSYALKSNGTVWAWGFNNDDELGNGNSTASYVPVEVTVSGGSPLSNIVSIASGAYFCMALKSDGTVWAWGMNGSGQLGNGSSGTNSPFAVQVSSLTGVVAIAGEGFSGTALKSDGTVYAWGYDYDGELGNGSNTDSHTPVQVSGLTGVSSIACGQYHGMAVKNDGTLSVWGYNFDGELGNGTNTNSNVPLQVSSLSGITSCAGGGTYSLALKSDGTVWAWGGNYAGQLGNGTINGSLVPVRVSNLTGTTVITAGFDQNTALKSDGSIWGWGLNFNNSQLGIGGPATQTALPTTVSNLSGVTGIAAGDSHYLALKSDGSVWTWDDTAPGQISDGITATGSISPVPVSGLPVITAIACGSFFNLALASDGSVWAWGQNTDGELANGTNSSYNQIPAKVSGLSGVTITAIAGGGSFGMALDSNGYVWTWGFNGDGELADGTTIPSTTAKQIPSASLSGVIAISAGTYRPVALESNGSVWTWGWSQFGELGSGTMTTTSIVPAQVSGLSGITAITAGYFHTMVRKNDGTVWTFGDNLDGQLGDGTTTSRDTPVEVSGLTSVTQISVSEDAYHSIALKSDGTLWAWGDNTSGQLGTGVYGPIGVSGSSPTGSKVPVQVLGLGGATATGLACGKYSTVALKSDGTVVQWGDRSYEPYAFSVPVQAGINLMQTNPAPAISPATGYYASSQTISISTSITSGVIHYTLDGTEPTVNSPTYTGSFTLSGDALVNAAVFVSGAMASPVESSQFYINDSTMSGLPATATGLSATVASGGEIDLSWTLGGPANYSAVNVYRSSDGGATYQLVAVLDPWATSYKDTNVQSGANYKYQVGTLNSSGESNTSPTSCVSPTAATTLSITVTAPSGATPYP